MIRPIVLFVSALVLIDIGFQSVGGVLLVVASVWLVWEACVWIDKQEDK